MRSKNTKVNYKRVYKVYSISTTWLDCYEIITIEEESETITNNQVFSPLTR